MILTIKQLKRRVIQGLAEPELFYMPFNQKGTLVINLLTYSAFNIDTNTTVDNGKYVAVKGSIVVKNLQDEIIYNGIGIENTNYIIKDLPYGTYNIKVIYSIEKLDNKWHTVILNKPIINEDIFLQWFPVYKCESYLKKYEQTQSFCIDNDYKFTNSQAIGRGIEYFKVIEDENVIIDEPVYDGNNKIVSCWNGNDIVNYILEYTSSIITPNSISNFSGHNKIIDENAYIGEFNDGVCRYELYSSVIDRTYQNYFAVEVENKGYRKNFTNSIKEQYKPFVDEFGRRPRYIPQVYGLNQPAQYLFKSVYRCLHHNYMFTDYSHNVTDDFTDEYSREFNGDKYWFLNNIIIITSPDFRYGIEIAYSTAQYKYLLEHYDIKDTMVIPKHTHLPYIDSPDIIFNSKMYKYYVDFNKRKEDEGYVYEFSDYLNGKKFTIISDVFSSNDFIYNETYGMYSMDSSSELSDESNDSVWFGIQAITCPNYSDDYDEYKKGR